MAFPNLPADLIAQLQKPVLSHKYDHGHAVILAGPFGQGGAVRLAAHAALRIGAGLVTIGAPQDAMIEHAGRKPHAIMLRKVQDAHDLTELLRDNRINALCLGPGSTPERAALLIRPILAWGRETVIDADAITALAQNRDLQADLHLNCVLTPHRGEFSRLCPEISFDHPNAAGLAAAKLGVTLCLKGPLTRMAAPDGRRYSHDCTGIFSAPWLATAGSGDVLAGLITGLMARGFDPLTATRLGVGLHAAAGRHLGPGLIADDLPLAIAGILSDALM